MLALRCREVIYNDNDANRWRDRVGFTARNFFKEGQSLLEIEQDMTTSSRSPFVMYLPADTKDGKREPCRYDFSPYMNLLGVASQMEVEY